MKRSMIILAAAVLLSGSVWAGPEEEFSAVVAAIKNGDQLIAQGKDRPAMEEYRQAQESLLKFKAAYPEWDPQVVSFRMRYLGERLGNWSEPPEEKSAAANAEVQALQRRVQFLERSGQQYQSQVNQLLSENNRLSVRLREALAIRPAAQEPAAVLETQARLEIATKELDRLQSRVRELETELAGIPKPDEARQNAQLLAETRKNLNQAVHEAEALRKQLAESRQAPPPIAASPPVAGQLEAQLQATRIALSAAQQELSRLRAETDDLRKQLAAKVTPEGEHLPTGGALKQVDRARLALSEGRWVDARHLLETELRSNETSAEAWYLLGRAGVESGDFSGAGRALNRALELAPELGAIHLEFARMYLRQPSPDLALSRWHYHRAMGMGSPRDPQLEREIGWEQSPAGR